MQPSATGLHEGELRSARAQVIEPGAVRRVAVLRALSLGDMVCATPALHALRSVFPRATVTLVGQAWAAEWASRCSAVDEFIALPPHPLIGQPARPAAWQDFVDRMTGMALDVALQMHGSGGISNGIVSQWQARHSVVFCEQGVPVPPGTWGVPWPDRGSEARRLMRLLHPLGATEDACGVLTLSHPVRACDRMALACLLEASGRPAGRGAGWVCVHPGSKWASRRWPAARFAEVARELSDRGHDILLTGGEGERSLVEEIRRQVPHAIDLCGRTDLWTLGAAIEGARLLICNDTGVSHIAAALGAPSVVVSCGSEVARWSPADPLRHRVLWSAPTCRPCMGSECSQPVHRCANDITVAQVLSACEEALLIRR